MAFKPRLVRLGSKLLMGGPNQVLVIGLGVVWGDIVRPWILKLYGEALMANSGQCTRVGVYVYVFVRVSVCVCAYYNRKGRGGGLPISFWLSSLSKPVRLSLSTVHSLLLSLSLPLSTVFIYIYIYSTVCVVGLGSWGT